MKKLSKIYVILGIICCIVLSSGFLQAQIPGCNPLLQTMDEQGPFHIRIYVHVIRDNNCEGGQMEQDVQEALSYLDEAFNPHNIFFVWDCAIDEICNSFLFVDPGAPANMFINPVNNPHPDGIDIYLFPDHPFPNANGSGLAAFERKAFYVAGNNNLSPFGSKVKSHVMSHEMGHCLGLLHTQHNTNVNGSPEVPSTGDELVTRDIDEANCEIAGDCICDTPADPNIGGEIFFPSCTWLGDEVDDNGDTYIPLTSNIMSRAPEDCWIDFTEGQGKRMRNAISLYPILQDVVVRDVIINDYTSSTTVWNIDNTPTGVVDIVESLIIEPGATLEISEEITVRFGEQSKIIIKPNANLILEGKLTSGLCGSNKWKGIEVWGNSDEHQFVQNGERAQGKFIGKEDAIVENAEIGVRLWGPTPQESGGLITCNKTTFRNNQRGIDFITYENYYPDFYPPSLAGNPVKYFANFSECSFITDIAYPHSENFHAFVNMYDVQGPRFIGCSFVNSYTPIVSNNIAYGYGISALESEFSVLPKCNDFTSPCSNFTRSLFQGLGNGIFTGAITEVNTPFIVKQADFRNCYVGILNRSVSGGTMLFNHFYLGGLPNTELPTDQIGIALNGLFNGMTLEENLFTRIDGDLDIRTIGISSFNIGLSNKVIRRNTFRGLNIGNEAGGNSGNASSGLLYECNFNTDNTEFDFLVCDNEFGTDRIKGSQRSLNPNNPSQVWATGNQFSNTGTSTDRDFSNQGGFNISYWYKTLGGTIEVPDEYSGIGALNEATENLCNKGFCEPPCKSVSELFAMKQNFYSERNNYEMASINYEAALTSGNTVLAEDQFSELTKSRQKMDADAYTVYIHALYDTVTWNKDTIRTWLLNMDSYGTDMMLAFDYLKEGDYQLGLNILNNAPIKFELTTAQMEDLANVHILYNILSEQSIFNLNNDALSKINTIVNSYGEYASGISKNILTLYRGRYFPPETCNHPTKLTNKRSEIGSPLADVITELLVYPNPSKNEVTFQGEQPDIKKSSLFVTDIYGRVVWEHQQKSGQINIVWDASNISNGIYFYRLIEDGVNKNSGRIIIQK